MATIISFLIVLVCLLLIAVVLIQNSKGGGLASSFSSSNQVMGVKKTADFIEKATWTLAVALLALCLISTAYNKPTEGDSNSSSVSKTRQMGSEVPAPAAAPVNQTNSAPAPQKDTAK